MAAAAADLTELDRLVVDCRACPRLVEWRELVAREKRAAYADQDYWGRPVPGFGPADARIAVVGLAPAAHGANRTGRMFTGDRSGDVLFAALYAAGLASQPDSTAIDDGMVLYATRMVSPVRCVPPENKPTPAERDTCRPWLVRELTLLAPTLRVIVVLGAFGWQALMATLAETGWPVPRPRPVFGHGAHVVLPGPTDLHVLGCYHVSPHNTFTGRLTPAMLADVFGRARELSGS
ncbi:MAG TPA: uracil-DNA glycosylase [Pseudonocardiaceae bacterium]|nr:uracil-DNA glycosylase [Pseudonocardiaceae bacterium]